MIRDVIILKRTEHYFSKPYTNSRIRQALDFKVRKERKKCNLQRLLTSQRIKSNYDSPKGNVSVALKCHIVPRPHCYLFDEI